MTRLARVNPHFLRLVYLAGFAAPLGFFCLFYFVPLGKLLLMSIWDGGWDPAPIYQIFNTPEYLRVLSTTLWISAITTCASVSIAYPVAFYLTRLSGWTFSVAIVCLIFPLLTSVVVRTFAWIVLLGRQGVVNDTLLAFGLVERPIQLLFNRWGVFIGLIHVLLPIAVMTMYGSMKQIDRRLIDAAYSLGGSSTTSFFKVFLPLSMPGVWAATLLVFIGAAGAYVTPVLLGGPNDGMLSVVIGRLLEESLEWRLAAAFSAMLFIAAVGIVALYSWVTMDRRAVGAL